MQKPLVFLYAKYHTNITTAQNGRTSHSQKQTNIDYLRINLKEMCWMYMKTTMMTFREHKTSKRRFYSYIRSLSIITMFMTSKLISKYDIIVIKIPMLLFLVGVLKPAIKNISNCNIGLIWIASDRESLSCLLAYQPVF